MKLLKGKRLQSDLTVIDQLLFSVVHSILVRPASVLVVGKRYQKCAIYHWNALV